MELDELKSSWNSLDNPAEGNQQLTSKIIVQMTQKNYHSKMNKIAYPEIIGIVICVISAIFIGLNFYKLDTLFFQGAGILSIMLLLALSVISLVSLQQLNNPGNLNKPYAETLKIFATRKLQFFKWQKLNITLSYLLLVTVIVLLSKLINGRDITDSKYFWIFSFTFGYIFLLFYSRLVSKYYKKTLSQAQELLEDLGPKF